MIDIHRGSFTALRILTYIMLIKAGVDAVMLVSKLTSSDIMLTIARTADFISIVACVLCLVGVTGISKRFVYVFRMMVAVLLLDSIAMLFAAIELRMSAGNYLTAAAVLKYIALASVAAERLLIGAAFLLLMKSFGSLLDSVGDHTASVTAERSGQIYLVCNTVCVILSLMREFAGIQTVIIMASVMDLVIIVIEIVMYRIAADAAFRYWRINAFREIEM